MTEQEALDFLNVLVSNGKYIHANNILAKFRENKNIDFLLKCCSEYKEFDKTNPNENIEKFVKQWNFYVNFIRKNNKNSYGKAIFSSQSKFDSTVLEESMFRIFKHICDNKIEVGNTKAYSNLYFSPLSFDDFKINTDIKMNCKDQDFAIYKNVNLEICGEKKNISFCVPVVAFECKTYLDKTMLESSIATSEKIKNGNPYCRFCIVTERYEVDKKVDIRHSRIDQIYVLRKNAKKSNHNDIDISIDVVKRLYHDTMDHLSRKWIDTEQNILTNGLVL